MRSTPFDPIEWNAPLGANWLAFNRRSRRSFTIPWQFHAHFARLELLGPQFVKFTLQVPALASFLQFGRGWRSIVCKTRNYLA
jgi:hypothetical protein